MEKAQILKQIRENGLVGAGGAGFPTYKKLEASVDTVIANAAECEPLLYSDKELLRRYPEEVIVGLKTAVELTGASKGIFAIKGKHSGLISNLEKFISPPIELFRLPDAYPVGDEQVLVWEVLNRIVPEGGIPLEVGVVVQNTGTLFNLFNSVKKGLPVTSRFVTVLGEVAKPFVGEAAIGTPISYLIDFSGAINPEFRNSYRILEGGPMTGNLAPDSSKPISKTTSGIIVFPENHYIIHQLNARENIIIKKAQSFCCMCKSCTELCPRFLIGHEMKPDRIMKSVSIFKELNTSAYLCCECGLCELYACPLDLSPRLVARQLKKKLFESGIKNPHRRKPGRVHSVREFRQVPSDRLIMKTNLKKYKVIPEQIPGIIEPNEVTILLKQHIGVPAQPVVNPGDKVEKNQVIGKVPEDKLGAFIHASIKGTVTEVNERFIKIKK